jgi:sterol O-acyltransferase
MASLEKRGHERSASAEFRSVDRTVQIYNATERLRSEIINYISNRLEEFSSEIKQTADLPSVDSFIKQPIVSALDLATTTKIGNESTTTGPTNVDTKRTSSAFPTKIFRMRSSILTELLEVSHIRSIRQIFISILVIVFLQVAITDLFELGTIDFRFDVIRWNFSNLSACFRLWLCLFLSTCTIVYNCFHFWAYKRLSFIPLKGKSNAKPTSLLIFDWIWFVGYCFYIGLFLLFPVHYILAENYPIVTRIIILIEQVRFLMKSHAFVRENAPRAILYGQIHSQEIKTEDVMNDKLNESNSGPQAFSVPHTPCPAFSKFLYFIFAPTLIYRDSYPRTSSVRWKYVISQLAQFVAAALFSYYLFYRFCLPVFRHFNSEHVTLKIFVLSILNCTLPGALLLFCAFYGFLHCWLNAFAEMLRFADRQFYSDWWTATSWSSYYRTWNIVVHDWLYTYIYRDCHKLLGVKYRLVSMYAVIFLSACVHEYILALAFGYFYPILFLQFAILGFISMLILPQRTQNIAFNIFIWTSLFVGLGMQMCLYSIEWYARQNCPRAINGPLDYFVPRTFFCRDVNDTLTINLRSSTTNNHPDL